MNVLSNGFVLEECDAIGIKTVNIDDFKKTMNNLQLTTNVLSSQHFNPFL
jgi:hypothetical protein